MSEDLLRTRELCQAPRTMLSTYAILMHPYCPDRESNPGLPRDRRGLWHCTTCLALGAIFTKCKKISFEMKKNIIKGPDTWCSAKVLACHAAGPGSIPGRGNKDALISHKSITWSLGIDLAPSFGARLDKLGASPQLKTKTNIMFNKNLK